MSRRHARPGSPSLADAEAIYRVMRRMAAIISYMLVFATGIGLLNKFLLADPIAKAGAEERAARVSADSLERVARVDADTMMVRQIALLSSSMSTIALAVQGAVYTRGEIDVMREARDRRADGLERRLEAIERERRRSP